VDGFKIIMVVDHREGTKTLKQCNV